MKGHFKTEEHNIGYTLFHWLQLRCGVDTVKPDVNVIKFVSSTVGRRVTAREAVAALEKIAKDSGREAYRLDSAIYHFQRRTPIRPTLSRGRSGSVTGAGGSRGKRTRRSRRTVR